MEKIHIFTDSSADIPKEIAEKYGIEILPITVTHDGKVMREYYDITAEEYWDILSDSKEIPQTAMITPTTFLESYQKAHEAGYTHIMGILINGAGSGTYAAACLAKDMFEEEHGKTMTIEILDSATYTYLYGRVVVEAAEMREMGESFEAIISLAKSHLARSEAYLGVYSLKHLKKSGRISGGAAFIGEALGLKPISHVYGAAVNVCDKVRGEKAMINGILKNIAARVDKPEKQTAILLYGKIDKEKVDEMKQKLVNELGFCDVTVLPIGVSVITNTGPQAIAVGYYGKR